MNNAQVLEELLTGFEISEFSREWIQRSKVDEAGIKSSYNLLRRIGLTDEKIATYAQLLGKDPESIERNYQKLSALGLTNEKIATSASLLGKDPETIERNYQSLSKFGLKDEKIASQAQLLGNDPETIERNYQNHIRLLRKDYKDRYSGRELLLTQAQLLGIPSTTIENNIQFLDHVGIDYHNGLLLGTTAQLKRKKMAWLLREVFDYRNIPQEEKHKTIERMYDFVRNNPQYLISSISTLEKKKTKLRAKIHD